MDTADTIKLQAIFDKIMAGGYDPVTAILESEQARGFKIIRPGDTSWFRATDWRAASVASINQKRVRLVLLDAFQSGRGAMTRTIQAIIDVGLKPTIIDPTRELSATLRRRGWAYRQEGSTFEDRETVWFPRKLHDSSAMRQTEPK